MPPTPGPVPNLWQRAATFAATRHRHHLRKDGVTPYIAHPFRVAMIVRDTFGCSDPAVLAAALLHDTIEDTPTDYDDICERFGPEVADLVAAVTKNMILPEAEREAEYDARLAKADWRARLIKLADVLDNSSDAFPGEGWGERMRSRCERALKLAAGDEPRHEPSRKGAAAVRAVLEQLRKV